MKSTIVLILVLLLGYDFATSVRRQLSIICTDSRGATLGVDIQGSGHLLGGLVPLRSEYSYAFVSFDLGIEGAKTLVSNSFGFAQVSDGLATKSVTFYSYPEEEIWGRFSRRDNALFVYDYGADEPVHELPCEVIFEQ